MDFTKLRAAALKDGDDEEAVTVNTRALIDKVLARYSGEWTTLRDSTKCRRRPSLVRHYQIRNPALGICSPLEHNESVRNTEACASTSYIKAVIGHK